MDDVTVIKRNKANFTSYVDMSHINDSNLLDSETTICEYVKGDYIITIEVRGDVNIKYKNDNYRYASEFPKELIEIIKNGELFDHKDVEVLDNNWFEMFLWDNNDKCVFYDLCDIENYSAEDLFNLCDESYDEYMNEL